MSLRFMTLSEIKSAVDTGKRVHYRSTAYGVVKDHLGQWLIRCNLNDSYIGLTWQDGVTLNGDPWHFFLG